MTERRGRRQMKNYGTLKYAFLKSLPVLFGYLFLGAAFGIMIVQAGYAPAWAFFCSLTVYAGSGEFLLVSLLASAESLATVFAMSFFVKFRAARPICEVRTARCRRNKPCSKMKIKIEE